MFGRITFFCACLLFQLSPAGITPGFGAIDWKTGILKHEPGIAAGVILSGRADSLFDYQQNVAIGEGILDAVFWLKLELDTSTLSNERLYLLIENQLLDSVILYTRKGDTYHPAALAGARIDHRDWPVVSNYPTFRIEGASLKNPLYLKARVTALSNLPVNVLTESEFQQFEIRLFTFGGIFFGILVLFFLINLVLFFLARRKLFLYALIYIFWIILVSSIFKGFAFRIIWPEWAAFNYYSPEFFLSVMTSTLALMAYYILRVEDYFPNWKKAFQAIIIAPIVAISLGLFLPKTWLVLLFNIVPHSVLLIMVVTSFLSWNRGNRAAMYFCIGWLAMFVASVLFLTKDFGFLPHNLVTDNAVYLGVLIEVCSLSLAIGEIVKNTLREKEETRRELQAAHQEMVQLRTQLKTKEEVVETTPGETSLQTINTFLPNPLSKRELEVLELLVAGKKNREISELLFVSENTTKKHISSIYKKLEVNNRAQVSAKTLTLTASNRSK